MVLSRLLKSGISSFLVTLSITLQLTACNSSNQSVTSDSNQSASESSEAYDTEAYDTREISLSWVAPSERENNQPMSLAEIAGYKIYYGPKPNKYSNSVNIKDGSASGYTIRSLRAGTYFFSLTTYDTDGRESQQSRPVKIVV
jgi:hypothetical protein